MSKVFVPPYCCNIGDVLAEDVTNNKGDTIVVKNTIVNEYIKNIFVELRIPCIWLYRQEEIYRQNFESDLIAVKNTYIDTRIRIKEILNRLALGNKLDYEECIDISRTIVSEIKESSHIMKCLIEIKSFDDYTYSHSVNVALYSMLIAKWLKLPESHIIEVIQAGLVHDMGKVLIPNNILNKKGKLTSEEFEVIKKHSKSGYDLIKDNKNVSDNVKSAVLLHHERVNGSGYPFGLYDQSISLFAKIISIADVYDAMTQNRVYKSMISPFDVFEIFLTDWLQMFDSTILNTFLKNLPAYYVGAEVLLTNGQKGQIVYIPPQKITKPVINAGSSYLDLSEHSNLKVVSLV